MNGENSHAVTSREYLTKHSAISTVLWIAGSDLKNSPEKITKSNQVKARIWEKTGKAESAMILYQSILQHERGFRPTMFTALVQTRFSSQTRVQMFEVFCNTLYQEWDDEAKGFRVSKRRRFKSN